MPPSIWGFAKYRGNLIYIFMYVIYGGPLWWCLYNYESTVKNVYTVWTSVN